MGRAARVGGFGALLIMPVAMVAQAATTSDAQVEANVLRALAAAPELSTQNVQSSTVYGTVTLSGTVATEAMRTRAENLVARAQGVQKVVDELTLGTTTTASAGMQAPDDTQQPVLQADGTYAPAAPAEPASPYVGVPGTGGPAQAPPGYMNGQQAYGGQTPPGTDEAPEQDGRGSSAPAVNRPGYPGNQPGYPPQTGYAPRPGDPQGSGYPQQPGNPPQPGYPQTGAYPQASGGYAQANIPQGQPGYTPAPPNGYPAAQGYAQQPYRQGYPPPPQGGQLPGLPVTVPAGALLRVRINRGLDSNHIQIGTPFDGTVLTDVAAGGAVAIPRGASVRGVVVDAKKAGTFKGQGELALQIDNVTLGGVTYPVVSDVWQREGRDKSVGTVNSALGLGVLGAIIGGVAGGGAGAAIGAGVGAGAGVAGSASSPGGRIVIPPEAVLNFHLAQPADVRTVSEQEMQRLAYSAGPGGSPRPLVQRRYPYGPPPPPPGYYPY